MKLIEFTATLADVTFGSIRDGFRELRRGFKAFRAAVRLYRGGNWQHEVMPSELQSGAANVHTHATLFVPAKQRIEAAEVDGIWRDALGNSLRSIDCGPPRISPEDCFRYSTKREDLGKLLRDPEMFEIYCKQAHGQHIREWLN